MEDSDVIKSRANRAKYIYTGLCIFCFMMFAMILWKQYGPRSYALRRVSYGKLNFRSVANPAKRGDIYSSDGKLLATTQTMYSIYMDFNSRGMTDSVFNKNVSKLASGLSSFFGNKSSSQYAAELRRYRSERRSYVKITPRLVNRLELLELRKLPLWNLRTNVGGRIEERVYMRDNPYGTLAQRTIGRVPNPENGVQGVGMEDTFNTHLAGINGISYERKISGSFWAPVNTSDFIDPVDGNDIVTTIDIELQDVAEDALKKSLEKHQANWGTAILMEVATGEIKVMANVSRSSNGTFHEDFNYAIGMSMEPGSTFKLVTLLSLLDDAGADIDELVECGNGRKKVGARVYVDSDNKGYGTITLREVFEKSSNIGFAMMAEKYYGKNPQKFIDDIKDMGFMDEFNMQINGESAPTLRSPKDKFWDGTSLGMMSTGYSAIMLSPLRTLMIYNAIANNAKMVSPLIVKRIEKNGKVLEEFNSKTLNSKICSNSTLKHVKKSLEGVVYDGTGALFLLNKHYKIAGKTGTAQILVDGTYKGRDGVHYLGSFAGYFPADNPKYSCIVAVKTFKPHGKDRKYYGGTTAGPVFKAIADRVYTHAIEWGHEIEKPILDKKTRSEIELAEKEGREPDIAAKEADAPIVVRSKAGDYRKTRKAINMLDVDKKSVTFAGNRTLDDLEEQQDALEDEQVVPNVVGMGLSDAVKIFNRLGIRVISNGKGTITSQSITKGSKAVKNSTIHLRLSL